MAFPKWAYGDPSNHADFTRKERAEYEEQQAMDAESAKERLEDLFKKEAVSDKPNK